MMDAFYYFALKYGILEFVEITFRNGKKKGGFRLLQRCYTILMDPEYDNLAPVLQRIHEYGERVEVSDGASKVSVWRSCWWLLNFFATNIRKLHGVNQCFFLQVFATMVINSRLVVALLKKALEEERMKHEVTRKQLTGSPKGGVQGQKQSNTEGEEEEELDDVEEQEDSGEEEEVEDREQDDEEEEEEEDEGEQEEEDAESEEEEEEEEEESDKEEPESDTQSAPSHHSMVIPSFCPFDLE